MGEGRTGAHGVSADQLNNDQIFSLTHDAIMRTVKELRKEQQMRFFLISARV